jgi:hypothetical protein
MLLQRLVRLLPIALSVGQDEIVTVIRSTPTNWHGVINVHLLANFDRLCTTRAQTFLAAEKAGVIRSGIMDAPIGILPRSHTLAVTACHSCRMAARSERNINPADQ